MDSLLNTHMAKLWKNLTACKYLQGTYAEQVSSQEPGAGCPVSLPCAKINIIVNILLILEREKHVIPLIHAFIG